MTHNFYSNLSSNLHNLGIKNTSHTIILECLYKFEEINLKGNQQPCSLSTSL